MNNDTILIGFGYTELESRLYCELLRQGPGGGYRLAQRIGKAAANVYQALKSMERKGAIVRSEGLGEATVYAATPPEHLLTTTRQDFTERHAALGDHLQQIRAPAPDERVYAVSTVALLLQRARDMLAKATDVVLFDFFPTIYDTLKPEIDDVRRRGLIVAGVAYEQRHKTADMPLNRASMDLIAHRWPGLGLCLVTDGREKLLAQVSTDMTRVLNGVWTDSIFLSCVFHSALAADIRLTALREDPTDPMRHITLQASTPPGLEIMLSRTEP